MSATAEVAKGLVDLCRQGKFMEAIEKYYSDKIVSVESASAPGMPAEMKGIEAVRGKTQWWEANHEVHSSEIGAPLVGDKQFAVQFKLDVTHKPSGKRMKMDEMALYTVEGGKIVHEHFFYNANG
jgi:SnoaL-like domain